MPGAVRSRARENPGCAEGCGEGANPTRRRGNPGRQVQRIVAGLVTESSCSPQRKVVPESVGFPREDRTLSVTAESRPRFRSTSDVADSSGRAISSPSRRIATDPGSATWSRSGEGTRHPVGMLPEKAPERGRSGAGCGPSRSPAGTRNRSTGREHSLHRPARERRGEKTPVRYRSPGRRNRSAAALPDRQGAGGSARTPPSGR